MSGSKTQRAKARGEPLPLTQRMELFCRYYVNPDTTAAQAYVQAGYKEGKPATMNRQIAKMLNDPRIKNRIAEIEGKMYDKLELTAQRLEEEYMAIAFSRLDQAVDWGEVDVPMGKDDSGNDIIRKVFVVQPKNADDMDPTTLAAIKEISLSGTGGVKISMHDKMKALDKLAVRYTRFQDRMAEPPPPEPDDEKYSDEQLQDLKDFFDASF